MKPLHRLILLLALTHQPLPAGDNADYLLARKHCLELQTTTGTPILGLPIREEATELRFLDIIAWKTHHIPLATLTPATLQQLAPWRAQPRLEFRGLFLGQTRTEVKELIRQGHFANLDETGIDILGAPTATQLATTPTGSTHHCQPRIGIQFRKDILITLTLTAARTTTPATATAWKEALTTALIEKYHPTPVPSPPGTHHPHQRWDNTLHESIYLGPTTGTPTLIYGFTLNAPIINPPILPPHKPGL